MKQFIRNFRIEYKKDGLSIASADPDPFRQFEKWLREYMKVTRSEFNAMTLATAGDDHQPSSRVVLLKDFDQRGFVFYTNYQSRKGKQLSENPKAALSFFWPELERQVRVEGVIEKTTEEESDDYFRTRPRRSQIGAWASAQSRKLKSRFSLLRTFLSYATRFTGKPVPRPPHWGGYRLIPHRIEFWQGRPNRLHDRICYQQKKDGSWMRERLFP